MSYKLRASHVTSIGFALAVFCAAGCETRNTGMQVLRVEPDFGGLEGGKSIKIIGRNMRLDIGYTVYFGRRPAPRVSILDTETLLAVAPRADAGTVDVTIRADHGPSFVVKDAFTYVDQAGALLP